MMRFPKRAAALVCAMLVLLTSLSAQAAPFSVLLIGVDTAGEAGRSDVMMLASVDPEAGDIRLVSFLRDLYVSIPGHGKDRLNAAYFYGGEALLKRTLEENFGVSVDHTLTAHFPTLVSAVDLMGGSSSTKSCRITTARWVFPKTTGCWRRLAHSFSAAVRR